jgi:hypothetical protein
MTDLDIAWMKRCSSSYVPEYSVYGTWDCKHSEEMENHHGTRCKSALDKTGKIPCYNEQSLAYQDTNNWVDTVEFLSEYFRDPTAAQGQRILGFPLPFIIDYEYASQAEP